MLNAAEEAFQHLLFQVALDTGTRPVEIGPDSTETGAYVYRRLADSGAVAEIYWVEGRGWWEDMRGSCPIRTDLPCELRCAALAEAAVLLMRRPHWSGYISVAVAVPGVMDAAAQQLRSVGAPPECFGQLSRGISPW
jgi:hypothetical protein